jgi:hypothetical protein
MANSATATQGCHLDAIQMAEPNAAPPHCSGSSSRRSIDSRVLSRVPVRVASPERRESSALSYKRRRASSGSVADAVSGTGTVSRLLHRLLSRRLPGGRIVP